MRCLDGNNHRIALLGLNRGCLAIRCFGDDETVTALCYEECFVVHFVPVRGWAAGVRGEVDWDCTEALGCCYAVAEDGLDGWGKGCQWGCGWVGGWMVGGEVWEVDICARVK